MPMVRCGVLVVGGRRKRVYREIGGLFGLCTKPYSRPNPDRQRPKTPTHSREW